MVKKELEYFNKDKKFYLKKVYIVLKIIPHI